MSSSSQPVVPNQVKQFFERTISRLNALKRNVEPTEIEEPSEAISEEKPPSRLLKGLGWSLYGLYLVAALLFGTLFGFIHQSDIAKGLVAGFLNPKDPIETFDSQDMTLLILGTDEDRTPGGERVVSTAARSDMIMIARLQFDKKLISGLTIPRDTLAEVPGYGPKRINSFHAIGGPELTEKAVESITGVKVDRVVVISYGVFQEMVDMLGGLEINVKKTMKYDDEAGGLHIDLKPGKQILSGEEAMGYVRYRRDSGYNRQQRQREFFVEFKRQSLEKWTKLPSIANRTGELTGNVFSNNELIALFQFGRQVDSSTIKLGMLPILEGENYDLMVDTEKLYDALVEYELIDSKA